MAVERLVGEGESAADDDGGPSEGMGMDRWYEIANADRVASPTILVYPERIEENLRRMIALVGDASRLRPHVKTHKLPQIIAMKRALGIDKFKTSTIAEAEMTAAAGGSDVMLAYQPVGPNAMRLARLAAQFPTTRFSTIVDNRGSLAEVAHAASQVGVVIDLFIDLNVGMNRTGIKADAAAVELYRIAASTPGVRAGGLHVYDGHLHESDETVLARRAEDAFAPVWHLKQTLEAEGLRVGTVVASGTPTSGLMSKHADVEVGAGTTVLWDFGQETLTPNLHFLNAAVLLARVISRPGNDLICLDVGHKAVASEMPQPRVRWFGLEDAVAVSHSEEHLVLQTERAAAFPVGSVFYGIPRHVCPTMALHQEVWCVRNGQAVETWPVVARNRRLTQ